MAGRLASLGTKLVSKTTSTTSSKCLRVRESVCELLADLLEMWGQLLHFPNHRLLNLIYGTQVDSRIKVGCIHCLFIWDLYNTED